MMKHTIITIGRQFGSGGHEVGNRLAERLDIPLYDHNLIRMADGADPLGHDDAGGPIAAADLPAQGGVRLVIQGAGRIVQHQNLRLSGQRSGNQKPLFLPAA